MLIKILEFSFIGVLLLMALVLNVYTIKKCIKNKSFFEAFVHVGHMFALLWLAVILIVSYVI